MMNQMIRASGHWISLALLIALPIVSVTCAGDLTEEEKEPFRTAGKGGASSGGAAAAAGEGGPGGSGASGGSAGSAGSAGSGGGSSLDLCVVPLFKSRLCSNDGCHGGMLVQAGLVLTETVLTQPEPLLVNRPNMGATGGCEAGIFKLIDSAEPEKSLIYTKLSTPPCGSKMPIVPPYLTATEAACVLSWIKSIPGVGRGGSGGAGGAGDAGSGAGSSGAGGAGGTTESAGHW